VSLFAFCSIQKKIKQENHVKISRGTCQKQFDRALPACKHYVVQHYCYQLYWYEALTEGDVVSKAEVALLLSSMFCNLVLHTICTFSIEFILSISYNELEKHCCMTKR